MARERDAAWRGSTKELRDRNLGFELLMNHMVAPQRMGNFTKRQSQHVKPRFSREFTKLQLTQQRNLHHDILTKLNRLIC